MTENETPNESPAITTDGPPAKLDLSRYRTAGLVENLVELISVPHALRRVFVTTIFLTIGVFVAFGAIFYEATMSGFGWLFLCGYSLIAGNSLGILLGVLRVFSRALGSIEALLTLTLRITDNAAEDCANLQSGSIRMPSAGELVEQVYEEVLLPTMEEAVSQAFGFLGGPILWLYRRSIGTAVRYVIKKMASRSMTKAEGEAAVEGTKKQIGAFAKYPEYIRSYTSRAADLVHRVGSKIRFYAMLPLYIAFSVCLFVATVPIVILRIFATGEPPE